MCKDSVECECDQRIPASERSHAVIRRWWLLASLYRRRTAAKEQAASFTSTILGSTTNYQFRKFQTARSRLYQSRFLQPNTHFAAFSEIYKIHKPLHRSKFKICRIFAIVCNFSVNFRDFCKILLKLTKIGDFRRDFHGILPELQEILDSFQKSTKF